MLGAYQCYQPGDIRSRIAAACSQHIAVVRPGYVYVKARRAKLNRWIRIVVVGEWIFALMGCD